MVARALAEAMRMNVNMYNNIASMMKGWRDKKQRQNNST